MITHVVEAVRRGVLADWSVECARTFTSELLACVSDLPATLHPLGFVHFELTGLLGSRDGERVRAHLWNPALAPVDDAGVIHDHTWHLKSGVLAGRIQNRNFRPVQEENGPFRGSKVDYGNVNAFRPSGRYRLDQLDEVTVGPGDVYQIPSRIVHSSKLLSDQAFTLVVAQSDERASLEGPLLLSPGSEAPSGTEQRIILAKEQAQKILVEFMQCL